MSYSIVPRGVLFDLDGTLADTIDDIAAAVNVVLHRYGYPEHEVYSYRSMVGNGFANLIRQALPSEVAGIESVFQAIFAESKQFYASHSIVKTKAYPGVDQLLDKLSDRGISIAVLSNKPDSMAKGMVRALFPRIAFMEVRGEIEGSPRKPDPSSALQIVASGPFQPKEWLFVGDSDVDMKTALAAGMGAIGASWGYRSREALLEAGAETILETPLELLSWF